MTLIEKPKKYKHPKLWREATQEIDGLYKIERDWWHLTIWNVEEIKLEPLGFEEVEQPIESPIKQIENILKNMGKIKSSELAELKTIVGMIDNNRSVVIDDVPSASSEGATIQSVACSMCSGNGKIMKIVWKYTAEFETCPNCLWWWIVIVSLS